MDTRSVSRWAAAYARAWELRDPDATAALFTPDAAYRSLIFNEPHTGSIAIRAYWQRATSTQSDVRVWMGAPLVDGQRAAIESWTVMTDEGEGLVTLPGCLLLEFDGGRCARLNEYWHSEPGAAEPYEGWGRITDGDTERTKDAAIRWTRGWKTGWEALDPAPIVATYSTDAIHRSMPLRAPEPGGVAGYLARCFPDESDVSSRFEVWASYGAQALTVYVATLNNSAEGGDVTIAGCDMLRFDDDGLCIEQRDYWNVASGRLPDGEGWPS
jgi:nuclear transport factor 2 (NTF2) superfamily protein